MDLLPPKIVSACVCCPQLRCYMGILIYKVSTDGDASACSFQPQLLILETGRGRTVNCAVYSCGAKYITVLEIISPLMNLNQDIAAITLALPFST